MNLEIAEGTLFVGRGKGDKPIYSESQLLYRVKVELNNLGYNFIKKEMVKDGHLTSEGQYYLRARKVKSLKSGEIYCIYDANYQVRDAAKDYNAGGVTYRIERM